MENKNEKITKLIEWDELKPDTTINFLLKNIINKINQIIDEFNKLK